MTEAEWVYAAQTGKTKTLHRPYRTGSPEPTDTTWLRHPRPISGSDMEKSSILRSAMGGVWEWTDECWNEFYDGVPSGELADNSKRCDLRVLRSFEPGINPWRDLSGFRFRYVKESRYYNFGFRVARDLD
jgi:formylglycine-generating enzyme required for sulfatase activity